MTTTDKSRPAASAMPAPDEHTKRALDAKIETLKVGEQRWAGLGIADRAALLERVHETVAAQAENWVAGAVRAKTLDPDSPLVGEEWLSGPYSTLTSLQALQHSLEDIAEGTSPVDGAKIGTAPGGRITVPVLPTSAYEYLLLHGFSADVWMKPGVTQEQVRITAGLGALTPTETGGVGLVLGAGNITSIAPLDVLYELIAHNPGIDHVHITGSAATHDVVVWGPGPEGAARREGGTRLLQKPITSELGGSRRSSSSPANGPRPTSASRPSTSRRSACTTGLQLHRRTGGPPQRGLATA